MLKNYKYPEEDGVFIFVLISYNTRKQNWFCCCIISSYFTGNIVLNILSLVNIPVFTAELFSIFLCCLNRACLATFQIVSPSCWRKYSTSSCLISRSPLQYLFCQLFIVPATLPVQFHFMGIILAIVSTKSIVNERTISYAS